jgi:hypothetical protein
MMFVMMRPDNTVRRHHPVLLSPAHQFADALASYSGEAFHLSPFIPYALAQRT